MRKLLTLLVFCLLAVSLPAQELQIKSFTRSLTDIMTSREQKKDFNGGICALIKVQMLDQIDRVEGNVIDWEEHGTEKHIYVTDGTKEIRIYAKSHLPLHVNCTQFGIERLESKAIYQLVLQSSGGMFNIKVTPPDAQIFVNDKSYTTDSTGRLTVSLPYNLYHYRITAEGYKDYEGSIFIDNRERMLETVLTPTNKQATRKPHKAQAKNLPPSRTFTVTDNKKTVSFLMKRIEAGTFQMGMGDSDDNTVHQVTLKRDYYMGETEVTQALWQAVMGQKPTADGRQWDSTDGVGDNYPAYYVSWKDCQKFIAELNAKLADQLEPGEQFRMPTEAEWEFAAKGGKQSKGYAYAGGDTITNVAWCYDNSENKSVEVKNKAPNELGLYDMSGNVWEWCQDWYGAYPPKAQTDPIGLPSASNRVNRGGSWFDYATDCRPANRHSRTPSLRSNIIGLRLALQ